MTEPVRRGRGRPKGSTNKPKPEVRTAVEPVAPTCDCSAKLKELEARLKFLEIRIL